MRSNDDRPTYPNIEQGIGYDPARFLASSMDPIPLLRGIQDLGVANAWLEVARDMDDVSEGDRRAIERRRDELLEEQ